MTSLEIENLLCASLHRVIEMPKKKLLANNPQMRDSFDVEFEVFLLHVRKKINKIQSYLQREHANTSDCTITSDTGNFVFTLLIKTSIQSKITIELKSSVSVDLPPAFMRSKFRPKYGYVYFLKSKFGYKVGCSSKIDKRIKELSVKLPFDVSLDSYVIAASFGQLERELHNLLVHKKINGEWFDLTQEDFYDLDKFFSNRYLVRIIKGSDEDKIFQHG